MNTISDELSEIAKQLDLVRVQFDSEEVRVPSQKIEESAKKIGKAWSGSWLGYHSRVYYRDFQPPPPGAHFSQEWGLRDVSFGDTVGQWVEYDYDHVRKEIFDTAGNPSLQVGRKLAETARVAIDDKRVEILSLLSTVLSERDDPFLGQLKENVEATTIPTASDFANSRRPSGQFITNDTVALGQGFRSPPHLDVWAEMMAIRVPMNVSEALSKMARQASSHLARRDRYSPPQHELGNKVFIGHGQSSIWRDLKDFIQDRLGLPWDEFNRIPVAGVTNIARLSQMLEGAAIAFLILTAEDELADGKLQARMNVIHEAGLFQGRLGFKKAIILVEEGCEQFSNIEGLGQIRFPKGNVKQIFEEIRRVLEREGVLHS
jgi:predicted nucleotide-binding protein